MSEYYHHLRECRRAENELAEEENYLNLWTYIRGRHPDKNLEDKSFCDLIHLKNSLEGPRQLRYGDEEIASVRKH